MDFDKKYIQEAADRVMIQDLLGRYAFAADYGRHGLKSALFSVFSVTGVGARA